MPRGVDIEHRVMPARRDEGHRCSPGAPCRAAGVASAALMRLQSVGACLIIATDLKALRNAMPSGERFLNRPAALRVTMHCGFKASLIDAGALSRRVDAVDVAWRLRADDDGRDAMRAARGGGVESAGEGELTRLSRKKACEYRACWLRTDKVFVYFTRLKLCDCECAFF